MKDHDPTVVNEVQVEELGLKNMSETELFDSLLRAGESWAEDERKLVVSAYELAKELHKDDPHHGGRPYVYHLLRNANRMVGYLHINDPELVAGIILHDSVEDHPKEIISFGLALQEKTAEMPVFDDPRAEQEAALATLGVLFNPRISYYVGLVTNAPSSENEGLSYDERIGKYRDKVEVAVETLEGWVIKFVDWSDNGVGIVFVDESEGPELLKHFEIKYGVVQPVFEKRFYQPDIQARLDSQAKAYVENQFRLGRERLEVADSA